MWMSIVQLVFYGRNHVVTIGLPEFPGHTWQKLSGHKVWDLMCLAQDDIIRMSQSGELKQRLKEADAL